MRRAWPGRSNPRPPTKAWSNRRFRTAHRDCRSRQRRAVRQVSPADLYVYEYDWSPDGKRFAATAAHGVGDNNWWLADLYTVSAAASDTKVVFHPGPQQQMENPRWSPDGKSIAFIGGLMSDEDVTGGEIFVASRWRVGQVRAQSHAGNSDVGEIDLPGSRPAASYSPRRATAARGISQLDPGQRQVERLWTGEESIGANDQTAVSVATDGRTFALIRRSWTAAAGSLGRPGGRVAGRHLRQSRAQADVGRSQEHPLEERRIDRAGLAPLSAEFRPEQALSAGGLRARRPCVGGRPSGRD